MPGSGWSTSFIAASAAASPKGSTDGSVVESALTSVPELSSISMSSKLLTPPPLPSLPPVVEDPSLPLGAEPLPPVLPPVLPPALPPAPELPPADGPTPSANVVEERVPVRTLMPLTLAPPPTRLLAALAAVPATATV